LFTLFTYLFTIVYMSKPKAFRFSPEVLAILEQQEDQKKYIEDLILKTPLKEKPKGSVPEISEARISYLLSQQTIEIIEALKPPKGTLATVVSQPIENSNQLEDFFYRSKRVIRSEINQLEADRFRELEYIQDEESTAKIHKKFQDKIDTLWREFHAQP
jgi:hypothetical protein